MIFCQESTVLLSLAKPDIVKIPSEWMVVVFGCMNNTSLEDVGIWNEEGITV
ncbi:hypothetical protein MTBBW1_640015 [Desulfamplus magnetovallimortis]|uniref:Uncharacterized protein n=1 Tax=Desulfamplus magnetovallimortis TaxID=1246637 RepID=A0A1W1HIS4_9BACT|nr:hypothetical protein MTBBW1_640015 [Desulfamplus magnetovallimortis]